VRFGTGRPCAGRGRDNGRAVSAEPTATSHRLGVAALAGFLWSYGGLLLGKVFFFLATLVLARVLVPEDFGLVAFALAVLAYVNNVAIHGVGETLVYRTDARDQRVASTAWWLAVGLSVVLVAAVWLLAPLVATFEDPDAVWVLRVISLYLVVASLTSTHGYLFRHDLQFRKLFLPTQLSGLVRGGSAVALALAGAGVWSLVGGQLAGAVVGAAALAWISRWRPSLSLARDQIAPMLRVGSAFTAVAILGEAARNLDFVIVGIRLGAEELGYYVLAFRLPELAVLALFEVAWGVLFPFYSRVRDERAEGDEDVHRRLGEAYVRTMRVGGLLAFPLALGMAALAQPLVTTLYGDRWEPSVWPLALVAVWAAVNAVGGMPGTVFKALGRPGLLTRCIVVYLVLLLPSLWLAAGYGIVEVAAAHLVVQAVYLVFLAFVTERVVPVPWWRTLTSLAPGIAVGAVVGAVLLGAAVALPAVPALVVGAVAGPVLFLAALRVLAPADLAALRGLARGLRRGADAAA
jgi:lipopolysaccharide exporter